MPPMQTDPGFEAAQVLGVELAVMGVGDRPDRADRFAVDIKGTSSPSSASGVAGPKYG